jgi:hypothetical protein
MGGCCLLPVTTDFRALEGTGSRGPFRGLTDVPTLNFDVKGALQAVQETGGHESKCYVRCSDIEGEKTVAQCLHSMADGRVEGRQIGCTGIVFANKDVRQLCRCGSDDRRMRCSGLAEGWKAALMRGRVVRIVR